MLERITEFPSWIKPFIRAKGDCAFIFARSTSISEKLTKRNDLHSRRVLYNFRVFKELYKHEWKLGRTLNRVRKAISSSLIFAHKRFSFRAFIRHDTDGNITWKQHQNINLRKPLYVNMFYRAVGQNVHYMTFSLCRTLWLCDKGGWTLQRGRKNTGFCRSNDTAKAFRHHLAQFYIVTRMRRSVRRTFTCYRRGHSMDIPWTFHASS